MERQPDQTLSKKMLTFFNMATSYCASN